jgi:methyl-accepting chemotaxis protein
MLTADDAGVDMHEHLVDEYAKQVASIQNNVRGVQRVMVDLAECTQAQTSTLDDIERHMTQASDFTERTTETIDQMEQNNHSKLLCCLLSVTVVTAAVIVAIVIIKSLQ